MKLQTTNDVEKLIKIARESGIKRLKVGTFEIEFKESVAPFGMPLPEAKPVPPEELERRLQKQAEELLFRSA